ncbi:DNA-directed DNA polymerase III (polc) [Allochromatium warmingii]|uniref:DNA polymerase III subunit alpha n=1 Tax=Allochromatium warmingii TaxID=61595 RepID=A0A1H3BLY5_ALLWA|nr:DNA polymerase III subunit alpha [Allochromatium warmingii]SDX42897.1 DNA-directed DNA polymerase III (polc) [Allochromatium warmingii]
MDATFVHLHLHSEYSLSDGLVRIKPLVKAVTVAGMPAVAVTDQSNLFALVRFYKAAVSAGVKPIAGADLWVRNPEDINQPHRIVLLAQNEPGYRNLTRLISRGFIEGQHRDAAQGVSQIEHDWLRDAHHGLIALSAGPRGDVAEALLKGRTELANQRLDAWLSIFADRYYLELIRSGRPQEGELIEASVDLAIRRGVPVVATNDVRFLAASDFEAHEARVCIHQGRTLDDARRPRDYSEEQYLRTPAEMAELFADLPEALANTVEIAKRCNLELKLGKNYLPSFPVPEGMTTDSFFAEQSRRGLAWRLERILDRTAPDYAERRRIYEERLTIELDVIIQMGFPGYFLIVADFIQWAKDNDIPVGPGRGSGAGSLVAYALKITDLDPIEHELLFERFLNPERVSMPDFDIDFCMEGRDRVIDYVAGKYGRDAVSQIITFGTMAAKAVVRDVGRVLGHPYGFVDKIAKMVPFELGMTLDKALKESEELKRAYEQDEEVRTLLDMARKLEGLTRNAGKHAGGVVIAPTVLTDFAPLYCEQGGVNLVTQYDKDDVEQVGLVKFDFLGLRTLTIIDWALKTINAQRAANGEPLLDIERIDPHDQVAFDLLKHCETTAVFQLESRGMKELIKKLQPDCFEEITALVALFRPGPLQSGMVDDFIERKHGRAEVAYPHPDLAPILKPTYGIILYQEQVMQIAQVLAGYSLGGADILRRCLAGSTEVIDAATGQHVTLAEIAATPDVWIGRDIFALNLQTQKIVRQPIAAVFHNGVQEVFEVITRTGRRIQATATHLFYTLMGWKPLGSFFEGETIALAVQLPIERAASLKSLAHKSDIFWDVIDSIRPLGRMEVFDLTIPEHHNFIANDFIAHNCMGKKKPEEMAKQRETFEQGALARGIDGQLSSHVFSLIEYFSGYGFNKTLASETQIATLNGTKKIVDCCSGDHVVSMELDGRLRVSTVIALHDHGQVPLWEVEFDDGVIEYCTLDHKWLTHHGQWPLWKILETGESIWGCSPNQSNVIFNACDALETQCLINHHVVLRRPVRATFVKLDQGYDLEVDHPEHNFLLASGLCCSNSHSAAYALVSYQTLWLKAHYPAAFMAAVLSADMDNTDKVVTLIDECRTLKLKVEPPAINRSDYHFTIADDQTILYGLGAVKGVGESAIEAMLEARRAGKPFRDLWDFCTRIDLQRVTRRVLESLIRAGALDELGPNRATLMAQLPLALKAAEQSRSTRAAGLVDLFGATEPSGPPAPDPQIACETQVDWDDDQRLEGEKETLGLYLTGHPIDRYADELKAMGGTRIARLLETDRELGRRDRRDREKRTVVGLVVSVRHGKTQRGRMGSIVLDDRSGRIEVTVFSELYDQVRSLLAADHILSVTGVLNFDEFRDAWSLRAESVRTFEDTRAGAADHVLLTLDLTDPAEYAHGLERVAELRAALLAYRDTARETSLPILLHYRCPHAVGELRFGTAWRVRPTDALFKQLRQVLGAECVRVAYERPIAAATIPEVSAPRLRVVS